MAAARAGGSGAWEPSPDPGVGGDDRPGADAALDAAIDDALAELSRDQLTAGQADERGDGSTDASAARSERWRRSRAGLRTAMHTLSARVVADRAEAAAATSAAGAPAAADGGDRVARGRASPFQWGFLGGLGVLIAYITFLVLDSIRDTLVMIAIATLLAIGLDPLVSMMTRRGLRRGAGVAVVFLGLLLVIAAAVYAIIPPIVNEVGSFVESVPTLITNLQTNETVHDLDQRFGLLDALRNSNIVQSVGSGAAGGILSAG